MNNNKIYNLISIVRILNGNFRAHVLTFKCIRLVVFIWCFSTYINWRSSRYQSDAVNNRPIVLVIRNQHLFRGAYYV